jgi:putative ATP-binding cassette transporter
MTLIHFLLRSSWLTLAIAILTGFISGISSAALIALISKAITSHSLGSIAWGFLGLAFIALCASIISQISLIRLSQDAVFKLRLRLSQQILASEYAHLEAIGNPRILATLTEDVQSVANAVFVIPFLCIDLATVLGCMVYITWLSWQVLVMVVIFAFLAINSCYWLLKEGGKLLTFAREDQDQLFKHFRTITEGIKELKLHYQRRQAFLTEDLQGAASQFRDHNTKGLTYFSMTNTWGRLLFFFAIGFVIFALPRLMTLNSQTLSGYILTFTYLMLPMEGLINKLPLISKANISLDKIDSLGLSLTNKGEKITIPPEPQKDWQRLQFKNISHTYFREGEDSNFILGPLNLEFHPKELVFIVGGNGSGKSTLAKIITGLYPPELGEIWLDDCQIKANNQEWYRQHFSTIFYDFYLFDRLLGIERYQLNSDVKEYLKELQLDNKVTIENGEISTTNLSQGQRKRLALLTAYLEDRPIYLFDEWASDQDPVFKEIFYTQILPKLRDKGKLVLVISHDDRYFYVADRIIKLNYGQIEYEKH